MVSLGMVDLTQEARAAQPLITVVIPTRNRRRLLEEAVESVRRQTYPNWELIVVDDCSQDDTWSYLTSLQDPRIRAIRLEQHSERSAARNRGLAEARGEYVLFLDDDDLLAPRSLELLAAEAARYPAAVGVAGGALQFDARGHRRRVRWPRRRWRGLVWPAILWGWWVLQGQALIKRDELVKSGGWDATLAGPEDQELWLRLGCRGPAVLVPELVLMNRCWVTWRGADTAEVEAEFRRQFVATLAGAEGVLARKVLASREAFGRAVQAYAENRFREAFLWWWRALRLAPRVVLAAPIRPTSLGLGLRIFVGLLAGGRAMTALRRLTAAARNRLRRAPAGVVEVSGSAVWKGSRHR